MSECLLGEGVLDTYSRRTYKRYVQIRRRNASRNGGEEANAELDDKYKRLRRLGAKLAHKAQWNK